MALDAPEFSRVSGPALDASRDISDITIIGEAWLSRCLIEGLDNVVAGLWDPLCMSAAPLPLFAAKCAGWLCPCRGLSLTHGRESIRDLQRKLSSRLARRPSSTPMRGQSLCVWGICPDAPRRRLRISYNRIPAPVWAGATVRQCVLPYLLIRLLLLTVRRFTQRKILLA